jgi:beta-carotene hydroxylase
MAIFSVSTYWGVTRATSFWPLSIVVNALCVYGIFTVMHEACHKNISRKYSRLEYAMGVVSCLLFHGSYDQFISIHLQHHNKVNVKGEDPDLHAEGPITLKTLFTWGCTLLVYLVFFIKNGMFQKRRQWGVVLPYVFIISLYVVSLFYGFTLELVLFWLIPTFFGTILTIYVFDHLPHRPHKDPGKYTNASFYPRKGMDWFYFMHSHHLVHHLWPSIPWYRYRECYHQRRSELLAAGSTER